MNRTAFKGRRSEKKNQRTKLRNELRKRENIERMGRRQRRSPAEQIRRLDERLGAGVGAVAERLRLSKKLDAFVEFVRAA